MTPTSLVNLATGVLFPGAWVLKSLAIWGRFRATLEVVVILLERKECSASRALGLLTDRVVMTLMALLILISPPAVRD